MNSKEKGSDWLFVISLTFHFFLDSSSFLYLPLAPVGERGEHSDGKVLP